MIEGVMSSLQLLAGFFEKPLYLVGGAVRNKLLGFESNDFDICGAILPEEIENRLKGSEFSVFHASPKLLTLIIKHNSTTFEYTAFRRDSYREGEHRPYAVSFTDDIFEDARRRDFTANALYLDIKKQELLDPLGKGLPDIKSKLLRTVIDPFAVLSQDGLRLMRLVRQAAELGFSIEEKTLFGAKENVNLINDIAPERIRDELQKIILADLKYGVADAHARGMRLLDEIGLLACILPELLLGKGVEQRKDFHEYDVFEHIMAVYKAAEPEVRLAALFHDIAKPACLHAHGKMHGHDKAGEVMARHIMNRLRYSNEEISFVTRLVSLHMYDLSCEAKESTLRGFVQENHTIVPSLIKLKHADSIGRGRGDAPNPSALRLEATLKRMQDEGIPMSIKELAVDGKDLICLGIPESKRGIALKRLLAAVRMGGGMLTRENQLKFLKANKF